MPDIVIRTEEEPKEKKPAQDSDIKNILKEADEYEKKKLEVEKLEALYLREQEIRAKMSMGGQTTAGQNIEKTPEQEAKEEAAKILEPHGY